MKLARIRSDYSTSKLTLMQSDDGDIIISIKTYGNDVFRIATSGGQFHGEQLVNIVKKFEELIDLLNEKGCRCTE